MSRSRSRAALAVAILVVLGVAVAAGVARARARGRPRVTFDCGETSLALAAVGSAVEVIPNAAGSGRCRIWSLEPTPHVLPLRGPPPGRFDFVEGDGLLKLECRFAGERVTRMGLTSLESGASVDVPLEGDVLWGELAPGGRFLLLACSETRVEVRSVRTLARVGQIDVSGTAGLLHSAHWQLSPGGDRLVTPADTGVVVWSTSTGGVAWVHSGDTPIPRGDSELDPSLFVGHTGNGDVVFKPTRDTLAVLRGADGVELSRVSLAGMSEHWPAVRLVLVGGEAFAFRTQRRRPAGIGDEDAAIEVHSLVTGAVLRRVALERKLWGEIVPFALSRDGASLFVGYPGGQVEVWDVPD